ncbi:MAG TPA: hypothetical protein VFQ39_20195 [Longimicrobium sp.]|nr:hypothetical protein [Longimicrobium sp.]
MKILAAVFLACLLASCASPKPEGEATGAAADERDTTALTAEDTLFRHSYNAAFRICRYNSAEIYRQAGTNDIRGAAEWFSKDVEEENRAAFREACFDALTDARNNPED